MFASAKSTNSNSTFQSSNCAVQADTKAVSTQNTNINMYLDCSVNLSGIRVSADTKCDNGTSISSSDGAKLRSEWARDCSQVANIDIASLKSTESTYSAACMQDAKNETKQKAEAVAGLTFPGTSAEAVNNNTTNSAQRAESLSSFYSLTAQETNVNMIQKASFNITNSDDICHIKTLLSSRTNQILNLKATVDDQVKSDMTTSMQQFNSNTTDQTAIAKADISMMWILILIMILVCFVMIGPALLRLVFSGAKKAFGVMRGGAGMVASGAGAVASRGAAAAGTVAHAAKSLATGAPPAGAPRGAPPAVPPPLAVPPAVPPPLAVPPAVPPPLAVP
jgi:hypothetical protein